MSILRKVGVVSAMTAILFAVSSLTPVILNLCWSAAFIAFCSFFHIAAAQINVVCWGILLASLARRKRRR